MKIDHLPNFAMNWKKYLLEIEADFGNSSSQSVEILALLKAKEEVQDSDLFQIGPHPIEHSSKELYYVSGKPC